MRVVDLDMPVGADTHHNQVRDRSARSAVDVRGSWPSGPTGIHRGEHRFRGFDNGEVDSDCACARQRDSGSTGDPDSNPTTWGQLADRHPASPVPRVGNPLGCERDEHRWWTGDRRRGARTVWIDSRPTREQSEVLEVPAEHIGRTATHPPIENRGVVRTEIDVIGHPIPLIEPDQRGLQSVHPALDVGPDHEMWG